MLAGEQAAFRLNTVTLTGTATVAGSLPITGNQMTMNGTLAIGALTDFFDGYLARKMNSVSKIGEILDPISDKILVAAALVVLVGGGVLSAWIAVLILSRETAVSGLRMAAAEQGFSIKVSSLGKIKTLLQDLSLTLLLTREPDIETIGMMILWVSIGFAYVSGYEYWTKFWERNKDQF